MNKQIKNLTKEQAQIFQKGFNKGFGKALGLCIAYLRKNEIPLKLVLNSHDVHVVEEMKEYVLKKRK